MDNNLNTQGNGSADESRAANGKPARYSPQEVTPYILKIPIALANKYHRGRDIEELISLGNLTLAKALNTYDPSKGAKLASWIYTSVKMKIVGRGEKRGRSVKPSISLSDTSANSRKSIGYYITDYRGNGGHLSVEDSDCLHHMISRISGDRKRVILLSLQGYSRREIAQRMRIALCVVQHLYRSAINKLRRIKRWIGKDRLANQSIQRWAKLHPKKHRKGSKKGGRIGGNKHATNMERQKKRIGWVHLRLGHCKILDLLQKEGSLTTDVISARLELTYMSTGKLLGYLRRNGYVTRKTNMGKGVANGGSKPSSWTITQKAVDEKDSAQCQKTKKKKSNMSKDKGRQETTSVTGPDVTDSVHLPSGDVSDAG